MDAKKALAAVNPLKGKQVFYKSTNSTSGLVRGIIYNKQKTYGLLVKGDYPAFNFNGEVIKSIKVDEEYGEGVIAVEIGDDAWLLKSNLYNLTPLTGDECFLAMETLGDEEMAALIKGMKKKDAIKKIKEEKTIPIKIIINNTKFVYDGKPHTLSYGYEIEFTHPSPANGLSNQLTNIQKAFDVGSNHSKQQMVEISEGVKIVIDKDNYQTKKDVVKVYDDGSVPYEIVTRPFLLQEVEELTKPIYATINKIMENKAGYDNCKAGGHITIMEGRHLKKPMNHLCISNFIQLTRAFYPQMCLLSSNSKVWRGTHYSCLNTRGSVINIRDNNKYSCVNKRYGKNNIVTGLEVRSFMSPNNEKVCYENASITNCLWKVAENISSGNNCISIKQFVIDNNKKINQAFNDRQLWKKTELTKDPTVKIMSKFFLRLIKEEAKKQGIYEVIKKRLGEKKLITLPKGITKEKQKLLIREIYNYRLQGLTRKTITEKVEENFGKAGIKLLEKM